MPSKDLTQVLKGITKMVVTYHHRAAATFLYFHPGIYGKGNIDDRYNRVSKTLGVDSDTIRQWFSLRELCLTRYMEKWVPLVKDMRWKDVAYFFFARGWSAQWEVHEG